MEGRWRYSQRYLDELIGKGEVFVIKGNLFKPYHINSAERQKLVKTLWTKEHYEVGTNEDGYKAVNGLLGSEIYNCFAKPVELITHLLRLTTGKESGEMVLDFFAGSCTTAHAVMKLNKEDGGNRRFIMVQLPEKCPENSEAFKAGFKTIADIGKERIRRAATQLNNKSGFQSKQELDTGFRVLKIDASNFKDCRLLPHEYKQETLIDMADNLLPNRNPLDLLFEAMLILGIDLTSPIRTQTIQNKRVFFIADNQAIACFDKGLTEDLAKVLATYKPQRAVFRDGSFASDAARTNMDQLFQQLSPATHITII